MVNLLKENKGFKPFLKRYLFIITSLSWHALFLKATAKAKEDYPYLFVISFSTAKPKIPFTF